jgi:hypothetical protein
MDKILHDIGVTLLALFAGLVPAALGAAVSLVYETGLTWSRRFTQMSVGIVVSYFATGVIRVLWPWGQADPFVLQAVSFVLGMIAFKATPKFIAGMSERVTDIPAALIDRFFPRKDRL